MIEMQINALETATLLDARKFRAFAGDLLDVGTKVRKLDSGEALLFVQQKKAGIHVNPYG